MGRSRNDEQPGLDGIMKPAREKAEKERLAKVKLRKYARQIPDNAVLTNILLSFPENPFRRQFYNQIRPFLKFDPVPLETINHE